ncbi:MAG: TPM domain-containing protein, partial [bacterium]
MAQKKKRATNLGIVAGFIVSYLLRATAFSQDFPEPRGYLNDFAQVVDPNATAQIEAIGRELEEKAGAQLAVVTVQSLGDEDDFDYAHRLFEKWGIGKKGKDNGVLLFLALGERRRVRIVTGYGLEGIMPDITAGRILDNYVIPKLRQRDYSGGLLAGTQAIAGLIAADAGVQITGAVRPNLARRSSRGKGSSPLSIIVLFLIIILLSRSRSLWPLLFLGGFGGGSGRHRDWGGGGGFG